MAGQAAVKDIFGNVWWITFVDLIFFFAFMKDAFNTFTYCSFFVGLYGVLGRAISLNEGWLVWWRNCITVVSLWVLFYFFKSIPKISLKDF
jgi:hypothetical protein